MWSRKGKGGVIAIGFWFHELNKSLPIKLVQNFQL